VSHHSERKEKCCEKGRSSQESIDLVKRRVDLKFVSFGLPVLIFGYILAAKVSTLGGRALPGLRKAGSFLNGIFSRLPYESVGGVAAKKIISHSLSTLLRRSYMHHLRTHDLPSWRSRCRLHTWNI
jgi:hypothetical protein